MLAVSVTAWSGSLTYWRHNASPALAMVVTLLSDIEDEMRVSTIFSRSALLVSSQPPSKEGETSAAPEEGR